MPFQLVHLLRWSHETFLVSTSTPLALKNTLAGKNFDGPSGATEVSDALQSPDRFQRAHKKAFGNQLPLFKLPMHSFDAQIATMC